MAKSIREECDINPLIASSEGILSLDARVLLHEPGVTDFPQPSIRPYPHHYVSVVELEAGEQVKLRPILPEDEGGPFGRGERDGR